LIAFVIGEYGRLDILVNNAGALVQPASWREFSTASWLATFDINLKSTVLCAQTAAEHLLRARGSIVNIASTFGPVLPAAGALPYGAAKAGVVAVTRSLAKELAPTVRVNCVAPGIVASDMTESAPADFVEQHRKETPLQRIGTPEDVAQAVAFLVSVKASFITGHVLIVDGGHSLR
jgi:3-oxoacyl-[acyl-carrier protein] reductase